METGERRRVIALTSRRDDFNYQALGANMERASGVFPSDAEQAATNINAAVCACVRRLKQARMPLSRVQQSGFCCIHCSLNTVVSFRLRF